MRIPIHRFLFFLSIAAGTILALAACAASQRDTVTVTFSVDGTEYPQTVQRGEIPVFAGSTEKAADSEHYYKFIGWDKEITPADADTVYTARYEALGTAVYTVNWVLLDDVITVQAHEGETPVPPEMEAVVTTDALTATFTGWDHEIAPVTGDVIYRAQYERKARTYSVSFQVDGKEFASAEVKYNTTPVCPIDTVPEKDGYYFSFWSNADAPVKGDTVCSAVFTKFPPDQLAWALKQGLIAYRAGSGDNTGSVFSQSSALLYLALEEHDNPQESEIRTRILAHLRNLISGGKEPYFDLQPYWNYCTLTAAIAVCKDTPTVWNALSEEETARLDCIMSSFAYVQTLGTADGNDYSTGPGLMGNFGKNWNPNYRLANVTPMLFVTSYFGSAQTVNEMLKSFDFDKQTALFQEYGFTRAYERWSTPAPTLANGKTGPSPKEFMENGGPAYYGAKMDGSADRLGISEGVAAGKGVGVRIEYKYKNCTLEEPAAIFNLLLENCYSGGKVIDSYGTYKDGTPKAYILNGGSSPVLGLDGMMLEFKSGDGGDGVHGADIRSSCSYTSHDFIMVTASLAALEALDIYHPEDEENLSVFRKVWVGNTDTIYKIETGYMSYSLGKAYESHESDANGYLLWKSWWNDRFGGMSYEDFPVPPKASVQTIDFESSPNWNSNGIEITNYGETFGIVDTPLAHGGTKAFQYRLQNTYNRIRFLELFDADSVGHEYEVSFWYYAKELPRLESDPSYANYFTVRAEQNIKAGKDGFAEQKISVGETGKWIQHTYRFTYTQEMADDSAFSLVFRFSHLGQVHAADSAGSGGVYAEILLDDLTITDLSE